ncbi:hypothetical protein ACF0H5_009063 [Mactra antiquata]
MASAALLRCCSRGSQAIFRSNLTSRLVIRPDVSSKTFSVTPVSSGALDYFRARRGPFTPEEKQGKHVMFSSTHWKIERVLAVSMLGIMPAALFVQGPIMDFVLTTSVFMHSFWAFDHVLSDYLQKFIPFIHYIWWAISIVAFAGLMNFNYNDVGVCKAISMLWKL